MHRRLALAAAGAALAAAGLAAPAQAAPATADQYVTDVKCSPTYTAPGATGTWYACANWWVSSANGVTVTKPQQCWVWNHTNKALRWYREAWMVNGATLDEASYADVPAGVGNSHTCGQLLTTLIPINQPTALVRASVQAVGQTGTAGANVYQTQP